MTAPDPRVGEIEARLTGITPGPWKTVRHDLSLYVEAESGELNPINLGYVGNRPENDAEFIANAPADVAFLLVELRKAREALQRVEGVAGRLEARAALNARVSGTGIYDDAMQLAADAATSIATITATDLRAAVAAANGDGRG